MLVQASKRNLLAVFASIACIASVSFWFCLPDPLFKDPVSTILFSRDGKLLGAKIATDEQWRFPATQDIPDKYQTAIIQFEDKRFYRHVGVDPLAFARAVYLNFKNRRIVSGGSTISMQVIRLARKHQARTYFEKLIELILALRLELRYSKNQILSLYASHAPFGGNVVGFETAAWRYFGRGPDRLSWAESCLLAVLPNSPALIHPGKNRQQLKNKRDGLLQKLHARGHLGKIELQLAQLEPLPHKPLPLPRLAPHLLETLISDGSNKQHRLQSTIDSRVQIVALNTVEQHARQLGLQHIRNVAALVIDNKRFEVVGYIGNSYSLILDDHGYAVDIIQSPRSTGSTLKPFLFATMLQAGEILPTTLVPDVPSQYAGYMPENYDRQYRGAVSAREALARSLNVSAVYMLHQHGVDRFYDFLTQFGMQSLFRQPDEYGLTLILGGAEVSLWDLSSMYANLATLASYSVVPGDTRYKNLKLLTQDINNTANNAELSAAAAWMTLQALLEVNRPGVDGFWRNFNSSQKIAWKTGTSYGLRDAWAVGVTPKYTVGVWAGNASGEGRPELTGLTAAAPVLFDIFNQLGPSSWFAKPYADMKQIEVCKNDGYLANGSCESESLWVPKESHFDRISPHNQLVHLDKRGNQRVHSRCENVGNMRHQSWFVLPPAQEFYYRRANSAYRLLPDYRSDCLEHIAGQEKTGPIDLLYPSYGSRIFIPTDLGRIRSRVVFEAVHRDSTARLFWHLNDSYLGETQYFHQQSLDIEAGVHQLVLVDEQGNRLTRRFEVFAKSEPGRL